MKRKIGVLLLVFILTFSVAPLHVVQAADGAAGVRIRVTSGVKAYKKALGKGQKLRLVVEAGTKKLRAEQVKFHSSKKSVATVSKKGVILAKKAGTAVITATYQNKKAKITVKVPANVLVTQTDGRRTLKNYLLGALLPVGRVLYVWGGGWYDSTRSGLDTYKIKWFNRQSADYDFHDYEDLSYENRKKGFDCSGYLGWCAYQVMWRKGKPKFSYTVVSGEIGEAYTDWKFGGAMGPKRLAKRKYILQPGDVGFRDGHCFIVLGQCKDKSIVILQSTPQAGVQISGTATPRGKAKSQAVRLAAKYMKKYFPKSVKKYRYKYYTGHFLPQYNYFRWFPKTLPDPDGYRNMDAEEILKDLFASAS